MFAQDLREETDRERGMLVRQNEIKYWDYNDYAERTMWMCFLFSLFSYPFCD
jgi:hypothetical protein